MTDRPIIRISTPVRSWRILTSSRTGDASERNIPPRVSTISTTRVAPASSPNVNHQVRPEGAATEDRLPRRLKARLLRPGPYRPRTD
jgi:hypothetical protein